MLPWTMEQQKLIKKLTKLHQIIKKSDVTEIGEDQDMLIHKA